MHFETMGQFADHLLKASVGEVIALQKGLEKCAVLVEKTAKSELGTYQPEVGPFQNWEELADVTKDDRVRLGYTENDPLLRSGNLQESITHEVAGLEAIIGSTSPVMAYQEFGTDKIPPRPVIGPAAFRNKEKIKNIIGVAAITGIAAGSAIHPSLGYNMESE
jgi:HK97 gp10 family phage protein